ncbi:unnamed protein product [Callosobruchus maculatus]|nr:unnamed protein product [Callosobruchus maculatus]
MMDSDLPSGTDMSSLNESSLNDTLQMTQCDVTMDDDALEMLQILKELERSVEEGKEDDCILSQVVKENEDEEDEKEVDMTLPLESIITPKNSPRHDAFSDGIENMDLDTTIIPQLDGQALDSDKETPSNVKLAVLEKDLGSIQRKGRFSKNKFIPKAFYIKLIDCRCANKSMPLLDEYCNSNDPKDKRIGKLSPIQLEKDTNCQKEIPRLPSTSGLDDKKSVNGRKNVVIRNFRRGGNTVKRSESKHVYEKWNNVKCNLTPAEEEVRVFEMRLKKINRKDDVSLLMKKIRKKDKEMALLLTRDCHPVFNVFPSTKYQQSSDQRVSKVNAIQYAASRIANYIEPTLHLTVEFPTKQLFHYSYQGGRYFPVVRNISDAKNLKIKSHLDNKPSPTNIVNSQILYPENTADFKINSNQVLEETLTQSKSELNNNILDNSSCPSVMEKKKHQELEKRMRNKPNSDFKATASGINGMHSKGVERKRESITRIKTNHDEKRTKDNPKALLKTPTSEISSVHPRSVKRKRKSIGRIKKISKKSELSDKCINHNLVNCQLSRCVKKRECQDREESVSCKFLGKIVDEVNLKSEAACLETTTQFVVLSLE